MKTIEVWANRNVWNTPELSREDRLSPKSNTMIHLIKSITDSLFSFLSDDPVRPNIPHTDRIGNNKDIFVLRNPNKVQAITCVSYQDFVPVDQSELFVDSKNPSVAIFYTIWSYESGSGRQLIYDAVSYIKENKPEITRFVTLSPKTKTAERFHLRNGAIIFRENPDSTNFEYLGDPRL